MRFYNVATLVNDLIVAQHELKLSRFLATLGKQELLVLDEFGFIPFSREGANLLFQLCSALYERVAVIITSNLKFSDWKSVTGGGTSDGCAAGQADTPGAYPRISGGVVPLSSAAAAGRTAGRAGRGR